jgi:hypothetical protein
MLEREGRDWRCRGSSRLWRGLIERYIVGSWALRAFWYCFGLIFGTFYMAIRRFLCIYCFTRGTGVRITLASAGGSACIAITPLVRLHQVNRVLID